MPGDGLPDPSDGLPIIGGVADNFIASMDPLSLPILGGAYYRSVAGVILQGCPDYAAEDVQPFREMPQCNCMPEQDGSELSLVYRWQGHEPPTNGSTAR